MSIHTSVFCASASTATFAQVVEIIEDGIFFDNEDVRYEGAPHDDGDDWSFIQIFYEISKKPVLIERVLGIDIKLLVGEEVDRIRNAGFDPAPWLDKISSAAVIYTCEIDPYATEDAWDMLAAVQSFLCKWGNGLIVAEEGVYNGDLQLISGFAPKTGEQVEGAGPQPETDMVIHSDS